MTVNLINNTVSIQQVPVLQFEPRYQQHCRCWLAAQLTDLCGVYEYMTGDAAELCYAATSKSDGVAA